MIAPSGEPVGHEPPAESTLHQHAHLEGDRVDKAIHEGMDPYALGGGDPEGHIPSWVKCLITLLEKNMKRNPPGPGKPAWGYLRTASGQSSMSGVVRTPAA